MKKENKHHLKKEIKIKKEIGTFWRSIYEDPVVHNKAAEQTEEVEETVRSANTEDMKQNEVTAREIET